MNKKLISTLIVFMGISGGAYAQNIGKNELQKLTNLKIYNSVQPGYWVHTTRYDPESPELKPSKEEGCVSKQELQRMLKPSEIKPSEKGQVIICDVNVKEDSSTKAVARLCEKTFKDSNYTLELQKITNDHYRATAHLANNFKVISDYRRTGACKAAQ